LLLPTSASCSDFQKVKSLDLGFLGVILLGGFEEQQGESFVESIKCIGGVQRQGNKFIHKFHRFCWWSKVQPVGAWIFQIFIHNMTSLLGNYISTLLFSCGSTSLPGCSSTVQRSSFDFFESSSPRKVVQKGIPLAATKHQHFDDEM
jgi:hypothetical protein